MYKSLVQQPVLSVVDASNWAFYKSGIFSNCSSKTVNHFVMLVGWTAKYWTAMNNWGPEWGENGMIRLAPGNTCAVCTIGVQPYLKD
jgi:cathepsin L